MDYAGPPPRRQSGSYWWVLWLVLGVFVVFAACGGGMLWMFLRTPGGGSKLDPPQVVFVKWKVHTVVEGNNYAKATVRNVGGPGQIRFVVKEFPKDSETDVNQEWQTVAYFDRGEERVIEIQMPGHTIFSKTRCKIYGGPVLSNSK